MDAVQVQKKLELSPDEDFILTAWQYQMMQRDIAASKGKHLPSKREIRNSFRDNAVAAIVARDQDDWSPAVAEVVHHVLCACRQTQRGCSTLQLLTDSSARRTLPPTALHIGPWPSLLHSRCM
ncbi:hypothetical protein OG308_18945 [Nocardia salmonicida]|uniref:Uncharacterized protein n=1 Tax=Nocardia salmonicida TaxID=53431 RepID=A0ABZ1N0N1_9NOCA